MTNEKLIAELRRRSNFPDDVPDRAFLVGIRYLLSQAADALEEAEPLTAEAYDAARALADEFEPYGGDGDPSRACGRGVCCLGQGHEGRCK